MIHRPIGRVHDIEPGIRIPQHFRTVVHAVESILSLPPNRGHGVRDGGVRQAVGGIVDVIVHQLLLRDAGPQVAALQLVEHGIPIVIPVIDQRSRAQ